MKITGLRGNHYYMFTELSRSADRNGGEFEDAILKMTVGDRRLALDELTLILTHRKRPPTWIR